MAGEITVTGLEETMQMLRDAPKTLVARGMVKALSAGGNVIANELERRTPVKAKDSGGLLDKGELRESVMVEVELDSNLRGGVAKVGFGKNGVVADFLEFGHVLVGHKPKNKALGTVQPNPFMRAAADASLDRGVDAFADSLKQTVTEELPQGKTA